MDGVTVVATYTVKDFGNAGPAIACGALADGVYRVRERKVGNDE